MKRSLVLLSLRRFSVAQPESREAFLKYFSQLKVDQQRIIENSIFEYKRQWKKYTDMQNSGKIISDPNGQERLTPAQIGRANVIVKAYSSFTTDELSYFSHALTKAAAGLKVSEEINPDIPDEINDFISSLIRSICS